MLTSTVTMHGSSTITTAVRISDTSAMSGVAIVGKPSPRAPWTKPENSMTIATHTIRAGVNASMVTILFDMRQVSGTVG